MTSSAVSGLPYGVCRVLDISIDIVPQVYIYLSILRSYI